MTTSLSDLGMTFADTSVQLNAASPQIESLTTSVATNNLTISWGGGSRYFRSATLSIGTPTLGVLTAASLVIPSGATLGAPAAITSASATMAASTTLTINTGPTAPIQVGSIIFQAGTRIGKVISLGTYAGGVGTGTLTLDALATFTAVAIVIINPVRLIKGITDTNIMFAVNQAGGINLDETGLLSSTVISAGSTSNNVVYSSSTFTNRPYKILGYLEIAQAVVGAYALNCEKVQGATASAMAAMWSIGNGQTWQTMAAQRILGQTYVNLSSSPITADVTATSTVGGAVLQCTIDGALILNGSSGSAAGNACGGYWIIPSGRTYNIVVSGGSGIFGSWAELK